MKRRTQPINVERSLRDGDFIVSKTDSRGRITYGNRIFIELSGYSEAELLGKQHNIVRHPDMPRGVFKFLWDTISAGKECFAYVKNMAKDGSFYWVFANVTPSYDEHGNIIGYYSVRRKPRPEAVRIMSQLYATMLDAERKAGAARACEASLAILSSALAEKGMSYEKFILSI